MQTIDLQLKSFVDRIERLSEEKKAIAEDIKDVFLEAKSSGLDVKALREVIRLRKMDKDERDNRDAIVATYLQALGEYSTTPLGQAAIQRARAA